MAASSFYSFTPIPTEAGVFKYDVELNADHEIFKGHFPTQPILPGACMLQMVKQITADHLGKSIQLVKAGNIKFLSFVDPNQSKHIQLELKLSAVEDKTRVDAQLIDKENVVFKFNGTFIEK